MAKKDTLAPEDGGFASGYDPRTDPGPVRLEDTPEFLKEAYPDYESAPTSAEEVPVEEEEVVPIKLDEE